MAQFGKEGVSEMSVSRLSQQTLADMVGTTRSRVSFFRNRLTRSNSAHFWTERGWMSRQNTRELPKRRSLCKHDSRSRMVRNLRMQLRSSKNALSQHFGPVRRLFY